MLQSHSSHLQSAAAPVDWWAETNQCSVRSPGDRSPPFSQHPELESTGRGV